MFTGIIQAVGKVAAVKLKGVDRSLQIATGKLDLCAIAVGDSIAVSGVCLSVVELLDDGFWADVSSETLERSTFADLRLGDRVNLELAVTPTTRLGGHLVSGHVDGVGTVMERREEGRSVRFCFQAPRALARYIAVKGSINVDGVSLTVNDVSGAQFEVNIVPHTLKETTIGEYVPRRRVNLEVDLIARYLERLLNEA
jgi:riboflavin synthase, alpha subunit